MKSPALSLLFALLAFDAHAGARLSVDTGSREQTRVFFNAVSAATVVANDWTGNADECAAGTTSKTVMDAVLLRVNLYRALAGVPATIGFTDDYNGKAQQAALMMSANSQLSHNPPSSWTCYTADGAEAASRSDLALWGSDTQSVDEFMEDFGADNAEVGHRRWILYPQTQQMGFGNVLQSASKPAASALWVIDDHLSDARPDTRDGYVAWPAPGFTPFSLIADVRGQPATRWSFSYPNADFHLATVTVSKAGQPLPVTVETVVDGAGENTLVWTPTDPLLQDPQANPGGDVTYEVRLANVLVDGVAKNFSYHVSLFDPSRYGADTLFPAVSGPEAPVVGAANEYGFTALPGMPDYEWASADIQALNFYEGAELGLGDLSAQVSDPNSLISTRIANTGLASFHLQHHPSAQTLTIDQDLLPGRDASLRFASRLGFATPDESGRVQISTDAGANWVDAYVQAGNNADEGRFSLKTIDLSAYAGRVIKIRFNFQYRSGGSWYNPGEGIGWYIDDIALEQVQALTELAVTTTRHGSFSFHPAQAGNHALFVRARVAGQYPSEWGPVKTVSAVSEESSSNTFRLVIGKVGTHAELTVNKLGDGIGRVVSNPAGIKCGQFCKRAFKTGEKLHLLPRPGKGSVFAGWGGACSGSGSCIVTMNQALEVSATFNKIPHNRLTVEKAGPGVGAIIHQPAVVQCRSRCGSQHRAGSLAKLLSKAGKKSAFAGWSGACGGTGRCVVSMDRAKTVTASLR